MVLIFNIVIQLVSLLWKPTNLYHYDIAYRYEWEETSRNSIRDDVRLTVERYRITETFLISVGIDLCIAFEGYTF